MQTADIINGAFELGGGIMNWLNVVAIYRDKKVRGINLWAWLLFTLWGYWNLYYYPSLNQWMSFLGGTVIVGANTVWIFLALKYRRN